MDSADAFKCLPAASHGVWHSLFYKLHCHLLPCFKGHSLWFHGMSSDSKLVSLLVLIGISVNNFIVASKLS